MSQQTLDRAVAVWCGGFAVLFGILGWAHRRRPSTQKGTTT